MVQLLGGKRTRTAAVLKRGARLGGNAEGDIFESEATFKRRGREKKLHLVEKEFDQKAHSRRPDLPNFGDAQKQFNIMQELMELNRKKKLGLPILPTIRLRTKKDGIKTLIMTRLKNTLDVEKNNMVVGFDVHNKHWRKAFLEIMRINSILKSNGYETDPDIFIFTKTPKGNILPWIADFGSVRKIKKVREK